MLDMVDVKNIQLGAPIEYGYLGIKKRLNLILKNVSLKGRLLDVGCGNGAQTIEFSKFVDLCVGIDIEDERLRFFRRMCKKLNIYNCRIVKKDATNFGFSDETFDVITCIEVLEHISNQEKALREMYRVLKKGGILILSVPNKWWIFETHGAALPILPWNRVPFFSYLPKRIHDKYAYARIYTKKEIVTLVEKAGFKIINVEYLMPPLDKVKNRILRHLGRKVLFKLEKTPVKVMGVSIFVFAKKV